MEEKVSDINIMEKTADEVTQAVVKEIKALGENTKKNYDELRKNYESLKSIVDAGLKDSQDYLKAIKTAADIVTRQDALDKKAAEVEAQFTKRLDDFEVILQRNGKYTGKDSEELDEVLKLFNIASISLKQGSTKESRALDVREFEIYKNALKKYIQKFDDQRMASSIFTPEEMKALSAGIEPDGGYLVTPAMSNTIITRLFEGDPIRRLASVENITTGSIEWLVDANEGDAGWETETMLGTKSTEPDWKKKKIDVHTMYSRNHVTQQLIEDSGINIETWLAGKISEKMNRVEGASFVTGDGIGKPRGFLTYSNGTTWGTIEQVGMGLAAAIAADGFGKVKYSLKEMFLNDPSLAWLMSRSTVLAVMLLKDGNGQYIWKPGITEDKASTILGDPVYMSTTMPTIAANALSVAYGAWKQAYMIVDRLGISIQRDPFTQKPFVEFYTRKRVGGDVINYDAIKIGKISV